jgi:histidyl-tRNA synthetase
MGVERLVQILQEQHAQSTMIDYTPNVFIISVGQQARSQALQAQQVLTSSGTSVQCHCGDGSIKNQFKKADKSGATIALIIGESEAAQNQVNIKLLRRTDVLKRPDFEQKIIPQNDVLNVVTNLLESL